MNTPLSSPPSHDGSTSLVQEARRFLADRTFGNTRPPQGIHPVTGFDLTRFLGTWYEIMRFNHGFENRLTNVSATYGLLDGGRISVTNRGFNPATGRWNQIRGTARLRGDPQTASLVVTFFWPLRGGLHAIDLDWGYTHAVLTGPSRKYLWFLSREPTLSDEVKDQMMEVARQAGFDPTKLLPVVHDRDDRPTR